LPEIVAGIDLAQRLAAGHVPAHRLPADWSTSSGPVPRPRCWSSTAWPARPTATPGLAGAGAPADAAGRTLRLHHALQFDHRGDPMMQAAAGAVLVILELADPEFGTRLASWSTPAEMPSARRPLAVAAPLLSPAPR
jgi:hypothetical protein